MAEWGRGRERIAAWPTGIASARRALLRGSPALRHAAATLAALLRRWIAAELAPGRLVPWLAIGFGLGIVLYFAAEREPAIWAGVSLMLVCAVAAYFARYRPLAFPLLLGGAAVAGGFAVSTARTATVSHPVLLHSAWNVTIAGWVERREQRERNDRIVIRVERIDGLRSGVTPDRVRVTVRKGTAPATGSFVRLRARLAPPLAPLRPGGYDFARDLYFQGYGASGFALGRVEAQEPPAPRGLWLETRAAVAGMRDAVDARIRAVIAGDRASIASALITGNRQAISAPVQDAMYVSGIGHVLAISGYHMALVAGAVFFFVRGLLALMPALASRAPIKKWAALAALAVAAFYLLLSGASVATQRAFIMVAIVLLGVMLDRQALTLRTITIAALIVLLLAPETLVHPSFQMSFAATLALIAAYQQGLHWRWQRDGSFAARAATWGVRGVAGLLVVSLVAWMATTPYAAYHFHRLAPYSLLTNLLTIPVFSLWIMPAGLLGVFAMPFGFDAPLWRLMGIGIDWMVAVATWVAALPGALGRIPAFGTGPLLLVTAGLILLCLLRTPLRFGGAVLALLASYWALSAPQPDILVAGDGRTMAVRGSDGRLAFARNGSDAFAVRDWLVADGDGRAAGDAGLGDGIRCDENGCIGRLADRRMVALSLTLEAFAEDCRLAAVVISARAVPPGCAAPLIIDRSFLHESGAVEIYRNGEEFTVRRARPRGYDRPWSSASTAAVANVRAAPRPPPASNAMPETEQPQPEYD